MHIDLDEALMAFPLDGDEIQGLDSDSVRLSNELIGGGVVVGRATLELVKFFDAGATIGELVAASHIDEARARELLEPLIANFIIVKKREFPWLRWGISRPHPNAVGTPMRIPELRQTDVPPELAVFGVALDLGGQLGPRVGPSVLRRQLSVPDSGPGRTLDFDAARILTRFPKVVDLGDVAYMGGESMEAVGQRISLIVRESWKRNITPIMLGGDHSWTHFPLRELVAGREEFGIIHFGAQADVYPMRHGLLTHGNVFLPALESPKLRCLLQLGLRGLVSSYGNLAFHGDDRVRYVSARRLAKLSPERVFAELPRELPYYVTFDATVLDATETGGPVIGGVSHDTCMNLCEYLWRSFRVIGADFVEVAGDMTRRNRAAESTARCIFALMSARAATAPIQSRAGAAARG